MKALAIIQARWGSKRLPGKVLADIEGSPLLAHIIRRVKASQVAKVVLACPDNAENDKVAAVGGAEGIDVFRGSEEDVLARFYWCAETYPGYEPIVRICGEDPFKDYRLIDFSLWFWQQEGGGVNYQYQHLGYRPIHEDGTATPNSACWPVGLDVEVFSREALATAFANATAEYDREHVTPWMAREFGVVHPGNPTPRLGYDYRRKWTIDTERQLNYARMVYGHLYKDNPLFGMAEIMEAKL